MQLTHERTKNGYTILNGEELKRYQALVHQTRTRHTPQKSIIARIMSIFF